MSKETALRFAHFIRDNEFDYFDSDNKWHGLLEKDILTDEQLYNRFVDETMPEEMSVKEEDYPKPLVELLLNVYGLNITEQEAEKILNDTASVENICLKEEDIRKEAIAFLESIRNYERENGQRICFDERTSEELYDHFKSHGISSIQYKEVPGGQYYDTPESFYEKTGIRTVYSSTGNPFE